MGTESKYYKELISKIERFVRKEYLHLIITGILQTFMIAVSCLLFFTILEYFGNFSSAVRTVFFFVSLLVLFASINYFILIPTFRYFNLFRKETHFDAAKRVGFFFPSLKDELLNSLQLVSDSEQNKFYSLSLIDAAFKKVYTKSGGVKFESVVKFDKAKRLSRSALVLLVTAILLIGFVPPIKAAANRFINFSKEFNSPAKFSFNVSPGNTEITKGEDILIDVSVDGIAPKEISVATKPEEETDFNFEEIQPDSTGHFKYKLNAVRSSLEYFATAEDINSEVYNIKVIDKPIVKMFELNIIPPRYSGIASSVQRNNGNIASLVGTKVKVNLSSTKSLSKAWLQFNDSTKVNLNINEDQATGEFTLKSDDQYSFMLFDDNENTNDSPVKYQIKVDYDEFPSIELISPKENVTLGNDNRVNLDAKVADDFGFSKFTLNYRLSSSKYQQTEDDFSSIELPVEKNQQQYSLDYIWNLTNLHPGVNDVFSFYLEIFDNDNVSGPKSAKTNILSIRVPSLEEVMANADETHTDVESQLEETLKQAEDLHKTFEEIDRDLKSKDEKLSWEQKEKIENAMNKYSELQKKVDDMNSQLNEMKEKLQENNLLSQETMEKYQELQKLMDEMTSDEMKKMMEQMQQMLQQLNKNMTQDALENMKFNEDQFKKSVERTLNLLKKIQIEQKVDEMIKRAENLEKMQNDLMEQTKNSDMKNSEQKNDLSKKQDEITDQLDKLEEQMKDLKDKMSDMKDMPIEKMESLNKNLEEQKNLEQSKQASQEIKQSDQTSAMQNQSQVSCNMKEMKKGLMEMQSGMKMQSQMKTFTDMLSLLDNMISLSKKQEDLKNQLESSDPNSSSLNESAQKQENIRNELSNVMKQMSDLSQKTFAISPEMGKAIGDANNQMQQSIQQMQNRNGSMAALEQTEAMKHLNEAASMMKSSMDAMMNSGGSGGMMSLMQQLQKLSGQQMDLNNMTQMLQQMQQGKMNRQQMGQMQRLAQEQQLIQKSLQQLNKEAKMSGESKRLPSNLEGILDKMQEVVKDMNTEKLDDNLIQKQENILSRMLDAQKSINERDFEKQRESKAGENLVRKSPGELNLEKSEKLDRIREELLRSIKEKYSPDYEELIRKYFEALQENQISN
jgi:Domain of unknown function (DUF4175)